MDRIQEIIDQGEVSEVKNCGGFKIPVELSYMHTQIGFNKTLQINGWTFISSSDLPVYNKDAPDDILNFAFKYDGLGWIKFAAVDLVYQKVFVRFDGGSNGFDVQLNIQKLKKYRENFAAENYAEKLIDFSEFLDLCGENTSDNELRLNNIMLW